MPRYEYECEYGHVTEKRGTLDEEAITCLHIVEPLVMGPRAIPVRYCGKIARRRAVYRDQSVTFVGEGFTRSVVPPPAPVPPSTFGETADIDFEKKDEFAKRSYDYERNVAPYKRRKAHG